MNTRNLLIENRDEYLQFALKIFNKSLKDLKQDVDILKCWLKEQKHLPEIPSDNIITTFLFSANFSIEMTKQRLDMYYTIKDLLPEFFRNKNPQLPNMQKEFDKLIVLPFPKTTPEGYRVFYIKLKPSTASDFNPDAVMGLFFNFGEILLHEDVPIGDIIIIDFEYVRIGHMRYVTPVYIKKSTFLLENAFKNRIKQIHLVKVPPFAESVVSLVKTVLREKLINRIYTHQDISTVFEYAPKKIFPKDLGGDEDCIENLQELWKEKIKEYQWRFDALDKIKVKEELRPIPLKNDEMLGYYGNFKKLEID